MKSNVTLYSFVSWSQFARFHKNKFDNQVFIVTYLNSNNKTSSNQVFFQGIFVPACVTFPLIMYDRYLLFVFNLTQCSW